MSEHLTIAFVTARAEPKLDWFLASLYRELVHPRNATSIRVVIVDFYKEQRINPPTSFIHVRAKPSVWQGKHRLTQHDYYACANAINTAICYAPDGWIAFVNDLLVLMPGWLNAVKEAMQGNYIVCGAYRKVNNMVVEDGLLKSFDSLPKGIDQRWKRGDDSKAVPCPPHWMFGCSNAAPVEAWLKINGSPEMCDGMGYEDCITGILMAKHGYKFRYDRRMLAYESEELHHVGTPMLRIDPGKSPRDKSHAMLSKLRLGKTSLNPYSIRELREKILNGGRFPVPKEPTHDWFTGQPLSEL